MPGKVIISIPNIFDKSQRTKTSHAKGIVGLVKLQKSHPKLFTDEFIIELNRILTVKKKESSVERLLEFVVSFAVKTPIPAVRETEDGEEKCNFALYIMEYFLLLCKASNSQVKFWSCYIIAELLANLPEETEIDDELFSRLINTLRDERVFDKDAKTRVQAIKALGRLQDPSDPKCPVMPAFLLLLAHDQAITVRKVVLMNIAITRASIDPIISRTRDVALAVRKYAFEILALKVDIGMLKTEQRVQILDAGLNDRESTVRTECLKLLRNWLQQRNGDPVELLKCLNVSKYESVAVDTVRAILTNRNIDQKPLHSIVDKLEESITSRTLKEPLTKELSLFWRVFVEEQIQVALENGYTDEPSVQSCTDLEITQFCLLINQQIEVEASDFTVLQLLRLAKSLDLGDEAGRRMLSLLLSDLIVSPNTSDDMLLQTFDILRLVHPNDSEFITLVTGNISTIIQPLEEFKEGDKIQKMEEHLDKAQDKLDKLQKKMKREKNQETKLEYKKEIDRIQIEAEPIEEQLGLFDTLQEFVFTRSLKSICFLFERTSMAFSDNFVKEIENTILAEALTQKSPDILKVAFSCLVHFMLDNEDKCTQYLPLYVTAITEHSELEEYTTIVMEVILKGFFDVCTWYSLKELEGKLNEDVETVIGHLLDFLLFDSKENFQRMVDLQDKLRFVYEHYTSKQIDYDDPIKCQALLRSIAAEGFAKLMLLDRIPFDGDYYDDILFQLILLFYSPDSMHQYTIRQCLTVFFSAYSGSSRAEHLYALQRMVIRCYRAVFQTDSEAIAHIDSSMMCSFLLSLTQPTTEDDSLFSVRCEIHQKIAIELAQEIVDCSGEYSAQWLTTLTSLLNQCALVNARYETLEELVNKIDEAVEAVPQVQVRRKISTIKTGIEKLMAETDPPTESEDEDENMDGENLSDAMRNQAITKEDDTEQCISLLQNGMQKMSLNEPLV